SEVGVVLLFKTTVGTTGEYYSSVQLSDIKNSDSSKVTVSNFLEIYFQSPVSISSEDIQFNKWDNTYSSDVTLTKVSDQLFNVAVKITAKESLAFTIDADNDIVIGFNSASGDPDLSTALEPFLDTIELTVDAEPDIYGTVEMTSVA
ncbi:hypothetical protein, partial [Escherichia coli]|uniref:hypothetical protein n=1 Tax=Escherichia coli TaxID=562 RepID=UPI001884D387